jgi:hypothetical protein
LLRKVDGGEEMLLRGFLARDTEIAALLSVARNDGGRGFSAFVLAGGLPEVREFLSTAPQGLQARPR